MIPKRYLQSGLAAKPIRFHSIKGIGGNTPHNARDDPTDDNDAGRRKIFGRKASPLSIMP
jgi:hypothetical protein